MKLTLKDKLISYNLKDRDKNKLWRDFIELNFKKLKTKELIRLKSRIKS